MKLFSSLFKSQQKAADPFENVNTPSPSTLPCLGAIIGDTIGSVYEFDNIKNTKFPLFQEIISEILSRIPAEFRIVLHQLNSVIQ